MTRKKKTLLIGAIILGILAILIGIWYFILRKPEGSTSGGAAYTTSISALTGGTAGTVNRFAGIVEPQQTLKIQKAADRKVKEVFVKEGDSVIKGAPLFAYDVDEIQMTLSEAELELERIANEIETLYDQIKTLQAEKEKAPESETFSYTTQILTAQNDAKRAEYNKKSKAAEIEQIRKSLENATVNSEIDGIVKSINDGTQNDYFGGDNDSAYMTILSNKKYRIKGTLNEQNMASIMNGQMMIIHSRVDENVTWTGTVAEIDTENPVSDNNSNMYMMNSNNSATQSSSYNFYVEIDGETPLMLGQHVFMEPDMGQSSPKEGLWLPGFYLVTDGNEAYVWTAGKNDKLEKRKISTGAYDESTDEYEIISGLTTEDYIAFPEESLREGMPCIKNETGGMMSGGDISTNDLIGDEVYSDDTGMTGGAMDGAGISVEEVSP